MPLKVVAGASEQDAERADVYIGTSKKSVTRIEYYTGSAWKLVQSFVPPMSLSLSPPGNIVTDKIFDLELVISKAVTCTPIGGKGPFIYSWAILSGAGVTASTATLATTTFRVFLDPGQMVSGVARCTVTDSLGTQRTADVNFFMQNPG